MPKLGSGGEGGLGDLGHLSARKKTVFYVDVFPYSSIQLDVDLVGAIFNLYEIALAAKKQSKTLKSAST